MSSQPTPPPAVRSQALSSKSFSSRPFDRDSFVSLVKSRSGHQIFSINTAAHILLPALIGSILALMLNYIGFKDADGNPMIRPPVSEAVSNKNESTQSTAPAKSPNFYLYYLIYASASVIASSLLTLGSVGLPTEEKDRLRAWTVASVGALTLPLTVGSLTGLSQAVEQAETEAQKAQEQLEIQSDSYEEVIDKYLETVENSDNPKQLLDPLEVLIEQAQEISQNTDENSTQILQDNLENIMEVEKVVNKVGIQETDIDIPQENEDSQDLDQLIDGIKGDLKEGIKQKESNRENSKENSKGTSRQAS